MAEAVTFDVEPAAPPPMAPAEPNAPPPLSNYAEDLGPVGGASVSGLPLPRRARVLLLLLLLVFFAFRFLVWVGQCCRGGLLGWTVLQRRS